MNCLEEYLKIYEQYPLNDKRLKKERDIALHNWQVNKNDYPLLKSEVCSFIQKNCDMINYVFMKQVIFPLISDCLQNEEYEFIDEFIQTIGISDLQKISIRDIIYGYCEDIQWKKWPMQLINEILQHLNSDLLLEFKFRLMRQHIDYAIHELPVGILETDIITMKNYHEVFCEIEEIAKKLDKKIDMDQVKIVYDAYFDYLNHLNEYASFEEFLNQYHIDYDC